MLKRAFQHFLNRTAGRLFPTKWKEFNELKYWKGRKAEEDVLRHDHYEAFYTTHFGLEPSFYQGKRVLDIGCGPRGSLEWADMAAERCGLDPLADEYAKLGADEHAMTYVAASSEAMPFEDGHFDVVCSFNSLDHVEDLDATVAEIKRVLKPGGLFLLLTDVNHDPTPYEPQSFSWDVVKAFRPELEPLNVAHYEKDAGGMYQSLARGERYDYDDPTERYGILSAKLAKR